jgi:hypothetical protein
MSQESQTPIQIDTFGEEPVKRKRGRPKKQNGLSTAEKIMLQRMDPQAIEQKKKLRGSNGHDKSLLVTPSNQDEITEQVQNFPENPTEQVQEPVIEEEERLTPKVDSFD